MRLCAIIHFKVSLAFEFALRAVHVAIFKMLVEIYLPWWSRVAIAVPVLLIRMMNASMMLHVLRGV